LKGKLAANNVQESDNQLIAEIQAYLYHIGRSVSFLVNSISQFDGSLNYQTNPNLFGLERRTLRALVSSFCIYSTDHERMINSSQLIRAKFTHFLKKGQVKNKRKHVLESWIRSLFKRPKYINLQPDWDQFEGSSEIPIDQRKFIVMNIIADKGSKASNELFSLNDLIILAKNNGLALDFDFEPLLSGLDNKTDDERYKNQIQIFLVKYYSAVIRNTIRRLKSWKDLISANAEDPNCLNYFDYLLLKPGEKNNQGIIAERLFALKSEEIINNNLRFENYHIIIKHSGLVEDQRDQVDFIFLISKRSNAKNDYRKLQNHPRRYKIQLTLNKNKRAKKIRIAKDEGVFLFNWDLYINGNNKAMALKGFNSFNILNQSSEQQLIEFLLSIVDSYEREILALKT
jgi:hypothetical protein